MSKEQLKEVKKFFLGTPGETGALMGDDELSAALTSKVSQYIIWLIKQAEIVERLQVKIKTINVECEYCGFEYHKQHEIDTPEGGYSCPLCELQQSQQKSEMFEKLIEKYDEVLGNICGHDGWRSIKEVQIYANQTMEELQGKVLGTEGKE